MRRIITAFTALSAAALFTVAAPAATGWISINGLTYGNPHGCYGPGHGNLTIVNHTNQKAVVHIGTRCEDEVDRVIEPGKSAYTENGASVAIR